jgi:hypothetical protein
MTDPAPTPAAITDAQLAVVGLARNARTVDDADAVTALLAGADPLLCLLFAARLIDALCHALAREHGDTADQLLDAMTVAAVKAAGDS